MAETALQDLTNITKMIRCAEDPMIRFAGITDDKITEEAR